MSLYFVKNTIPRIHALQDDTGCRNRVGARLDHLLVDMINSRNLRRRFDNDGRDP